MLNPLSRFLADLVIRKPWLLIGLAALIWGASFWAILRKERFDSDILNLLPADNRAVQGLKIYNRAFSPNRELALVIRGESPEEIEAFTEDLIHDLRRQDWVQRILDGPPIETELGRKTFAPLGAALLLNLPPATFIELRDSLQPERLARRLERLTAQVKAGSPRAEFELANDPLGLLAPALAPLTATLSLQTEFGLVSPNGRVRLLPIIVKPELADAPACVAIMERVHAVIAETRRLTGSPAPEVLVTGRAAYVAEISARMQQDLRRTSLISLFAICGLFWLGYRRIFPLIGSALILMGCAVASLGTGTLFYTSLNVVAIGFCSILFGLGNDYSLLIYESYQTAWRQTRDYAKSTRIALGHAIRGISFVAVTTAAAFLALTFSGSPGFAQLGLLTALGIAFCATAMLSLFLVWLRFHRPNGEESFRSKNPLQTGLTQLSPRALRIGLLGMGLITLVAISPWRPIHFDLSPASLEPKDLPASFALQQIQNAFPDSSEPVLIIGNGPELARQVDARLSQLKSDGAIRGFSGASVLFGDRARVAQNLMAWQEKRLTREMLITGLTDAGLNAEEFGESLRLLEQLHNASAVDLTQSLPDESPWWFVIERFISTEREQFIAYVQPLSRGEFNEGLLGPLAAEVYVTGWSTLLRSLVPWAKRELWVYGGAVAGIILFILAAIYRDWRLWGLHVFALLIAAAGLIATLKCFNLPLNLLNVLAFPLILGTGVDYGTHLLLTLRERGDWPNAVARVFRPIVFGALTTISGFGALAFASNPALRGLGQLCAIGVSWTLLSALLVVLPGVALLARSRSVK